MSRPRFCLVLGHLLLRPKHFVLKKRQFTSLQKVEASAFFLSGQLFNSESIILLNLKCIQHKTRKYKIVQRFDGLFLRL